MEKKLQKRIGILEALRFLMSLIVMHSHLQIGDYSKPYFYNGDLAVMFFFMLSGFGVVYKSVISGADDIKYEKFNIIKAYKNAFRKMRKLYFWYIIFLMLSLPSQFFMLNEWHGAVYAVIGSILTVLITPTMTQSVITGTHLTSHLGLGAYWFVSALFCIYIIIPLLFALRQRVNRYVKAGGVLLTFALSEIVYVLFRQLERIPLLSDISYSSPWMNVFYFFLGMLLCDCYFKYKEHKGDLTVLEIVALSSFFIWLIGRHSLFAGISDFTEQTIDVIVNMLLLFVFSFEKGIISHKVLQGGILIRLGAYSMYIYLGHYFLVQNISMIFRLFEWQSEKHKDICLLAGVCILIIPLCLFMKKISDKRMTKN